MSEPSSPFGMFTIAPPGDPFEKTCELLRLTLAVGVPFMIHRIRECGGPTESDFARMREFGRVLAEKGDQLMFAPSKKQRGVPADLMNQLIEAIAIGACIPGGVTFLGCHWEADAGNQAGAASAAGRAAMTKDSKIAEQAEKGVEAQLAIIRAMKPLTKKHRLRVFAVIRHLMAADILAPGILAAVNRGLKP